MRQPESKRPSDVEPVWMPCPEPFDAAEHHIDLWRLSLDKDERGVARRERVYTALHSILGRYLAVPQNAVRIARADGGKPYVDGGQNRPEFNLSHCIDLALIAVNTRHAVGVDIELPRVVADPMRMARRVFDAAAMRQLQETPEAHRQTRFFELWTALEARQKTLGRGIFAPPVDAAEMRCFGLRPSPDHVASVCIQDTTADLVFRCYDYGSSFS